MFEELPEAKPVVPVQSLSSTTNKTISSLLQLKAEAFSPAQYMLDERLHWVTTARQRLNVSQQESLSQCRLCAVRCDPRRNAVSPSAE